ncbi:MAG: glycosyltransferase [Limnothrix sp. RL_2_0]|nr:glycosyltransferase [Limnothrix sp. RL_2_0]
MTHFGIICPATTSHLNCMTGIGYELKRRGHRVTVLGIADSKVKALSADLEFYLIGKSDFPEGCIKEISTKLGKLQGLEALKYTLFRLEKGVELCFRDIPNAIKEAGIEALLVDQVIAAGGTIAEHLNIPFITVCNALMLNQEIGVPPGNLSWKYDPSWLGLLRNKIGYISVNRFGKPMLKLINKTRNKWNLPLYDNFDQSYSQLAQITHLLAELDFPRKELPSHFHFVGPYFNTTTRQSVDFPYEKLTGQPLIYASMGTLQNRLSWIFEMIAQACKDLDVQLVMSLGGGASPEEINFPNNPIVVSYAPQLELLKKASLTITHAGPNTVLESLANGVPMVAIPITNDQPGTASRIAWTQTGKIIPLKKVNNKRLHKLIKQVLTESIYKRNALRLQKTIQKSGRINLATDIIEQAVSTGQPILSNTLNSSVSQVTKNQEKTR